MVGLTCTYAARIKKQWLRHTLIGVSIVFSVALGVLGAKSLVEMLLYAQPFGLRIAKNVYAFVADVVVMLINLPVCVSLRKVI